MIAADRQQKTLMTVLHHQKKKKQVSTQFHLLYPWNTNNTLNKDFDTTIYFRKENNKCTCPAHYTV